MAPDTRRILGWTEGEASALARILGAQPHWFRFWLRFDPVPVYSAMQSRVLAVLGAVDQQVPPELNRPLVEQALSSVERHTILTLPGINHLMQDAVNGSPTEYGRIDHAISPRVVGAIADWLERRF